MMREANFFASLSLYGICGVLWLYRGSLLDLAAHAGSLYAKLGARGLNPRRR
jgi:hypothetical protein